jgi:hypothetical protein
MREIMVKKIEETVNVPAETSTRPRRRRKPRWPAPLKRLSKATDNVLKQCDAKQAQAVADYLLETGMEVIAATTQRALILLVQNGPMERLLTAIATYAAHTKTPIDDVAIALIRKLGPDAVEEGNLN